MHLLPHNLNLYSCRKGVLNAIANLVPYYFRFKIYEEGKRKSLCKDKVLFIFDDDEFEKGYRLTNESDADRVRQVDIEDDVIAINHLVRAKLKLTGTEFDKQIEDVITKLQQRVDRRSMSIYNKRSDIF